MAQCKNRRPAGTATSGEAELTGTTRKTCFPRPAAGAYGLNTVKEKAGNTIGFPRNVSGMLHAGAPMVPYQPAIGLTRGGGTRLMTPCCCALKANFWQHRSPQKSYCCGRVGATYSPEVETSNSETVAGGVGAALPVGRLCSRKTKQNTRHRVRLTMFISCCDSLTHLPALMLRAQLGRGTLAR